MIQGATKNIKFGFADQYGTAIKTVTDNTDLSWKVDLTKLSGDDNAVTTTTLATGTDESAVASIPVAAATDKVGSYRLTLTLVKTSDSSQVGAASTVITVVKNNQSGLTYSVADIATLAGDKVYAASDAYATKLAIKAVDANGVEYVINPADIVNVTSSNDNIAKVAKNVNDWYVFGADIHTETADKAAVVTVQINTLDGIKTITKDVKVSPVAPQVKTVKLIDTALAGPTTTIPSTVKDVTSVTFTNNAAALAGASINVVGLDQYGVWSSIADTNVTVIVNSTDVAPYDAFTVTGGKLTLKSGKTITAGKEAKVTILSGAGSVQITVTKTAE